MKHFDLKKGQLLNIMPFNREIKPNISLQNSLRKYGFIDTIKVVQTSIWGKRNGLYIIDGQHRYNEGLRLGLIIPCSLVLISDNLQEIVDITSKYNNIQRKWTNDNYIDCFCALNNSDYMYLRAKKGQTGFTYATLAAIYSNISTRGKGGSLKKGTFKIADKSKGDLMCDYTLDILKISKFSMRAILGFISFHNSLRVYNHSKFITNLKVNLPVLSDCMETTQFAEKFNEIYNK